MSQLSDVWSINLNGRNRMGIATSQTQAFKATALCIKAQVAAQRVERIEDLSRKTVVERDERKLS